MLFFRNAGPDTHAHLTPEQKSAMAQQWNDWVERLAAQGKLPHAHPLGLGGRVVSGPTGQRVTDGPYAEAKEVVGGYFFSPSPISMRPPPSPNSAPACPSA